jgi:hypothetical protein
MSRALREPVELLALDVAHGDFQEREPALDLRQGSRSGPAQDPRREDAVRALVEQRPHGVQAVNEIRAVAMSTGRYLGTLPL